MWVASDRPCGHSFGWEAPVTVHLGRGFLLKCAGPWSQGLVLHAGVLSCTVVMGFPSPSLFPPKGTKKPRWPPSCGASFFGDLKSVEFNAFASPLDHALRPTRTGLVTRNRALLRGGESPQADRGTETYSGGRLCSLRKTRRRRRGRPQRARTP
jgi:hypothetical protein